MFPSTLMRSAAAIAASAAAGMFATGAMATPANSGFHPENLVTADFDQEAHVNSDRVKFQTKGPTDTRVQKIIFDAGGSTGWHHHPGIIIANIAAGAVTFWNSSCQQTTYGPGLPAGEVFVESDEHPVQVTSSAGATAYVFYVAPSADPPVFRLDDPAPPCATATTFRTPPKKR